MTGPKWFDEFSFTECDFLLFLFFVLTYPEHDTFISNQKSGMMFKNAFKFSKGMGWEWCWKRIINNSLEALPVDNGRTGFIIFLFGDPHLLESGQWCQDRSSNPYWVFPFGRSNDLNFHGRWGQGGDFFLHTIWNLKNKFNLNEKIIILVFYITFLSLLTNSWSRRVH